MTTTHDDERWEALFAGARLEDPSPEFLDRLEARLATETPGRDSPARARRLRLLFLPLAAAVLLVAIRLLAGGGAGTAEGPEPRTPSAEAPGNRGAEAVASLPAIPVRFDPAARKGKEKEWSLMELVREADLILAGRFRSESRFETERVLRGAAGSSPVELLTDTGLVCPRSASPHEGVLAVVFCVRGPDGLVVPSSSFLVEFRDVAAYLAFSDRVVAYRSPEAADAIARRIRALFRAGSFSGKEIDAADRRLLTELARRLSEAGAAGPAAAREALEAWKEGLGADDRARLGRLLARTAGREGAGRFDELRLLTRDLGVLGDLRAVVSLLELEVDPVAAGADPHAELVAALVGVRAGLPASGAVASLPARIARLREALGVPGAARPDADPAALRAAVEDLRDRLCRRLALDADAGLDARLAALDHLAGRGPAVLADADVVRLVEDPGLPFVLRQIAVEVAGTRRLGAAADGLVELLRNTPREGRGPTPNRPWRHSRVSALSIRLDAIDAIGRIGEPRVVPALESVLAADPEPDGMEATRLKAVIRSLSSRR